MDTLYNDGTGASLGGDVDNWYDPADEILARLDQLGSQLMLVEPAPSRAADTAGKAAQFETFINYARAWCELNSVAYIPLHHRLGMHSGGGEHDSLRRYQKAGYSGVDDYSASSDSYIHLTTAGRYAYATALAEAIRGHRMSWQRPSLTYSTDDRQTPVDGQRQQIDATLEDTGTTIPATLSTLSTFDSTSDVVTVGTNNDKTGYSLSAAGVQAIWDALTSALTTAGSVGKRIVDYLNAAITSRSSHSAADVTGGTTVAAAVTHGDANWATATGFSTHTAADVKTAIEADGSKLDHIWETTEDDGGTRRFTTNALEQAPSGSTAVTVTPLASQTSATGGVTKSYLTGYQHAKLGTWIIAITDADGDAMDLSSRDLAMCFWPAKTTPSAPSFVLANYDGATDITIGGASNNQLTITGDDAHTETAGTFDWVIRDETNDRVLAEGQLTIKTAADTA
jgi:hypothetical protein